MIVLDTDHITLLQRGGIAATRIQRRLVLEGNSVPVTSIITLEEQVRGWMSELAKARDMNDQIILYARLETLCGFYGGAEILGFNEPAAVEFQRLVKLKLRMGTMDLKIAAIALAHNATLLTRNAVDFRRVPSLRFEDATAT